MMVSDDLKCYCGDILGMPRFKGQAVHLTPYVACFIACRSNIKSFWYARPRPYSLAELWALIENPFWHTGIIGKADCPDAKDVQ